MKGLSIQSRMPKPYLLEVMDDYMNVVNNIDDIIVSTGYRNEYIAKKLGLPVSTYYVKKRKKTFAAKEVYMIIKMLEDDENHEELVLAKSRMNDEEISADEFLQRLTEMKN